LYVTLADNGKIEKTGLKNGTYKMTECKNKLKMHAAIKYGFANKPNIKKQ
jgi:hypothetical protein